MKKLIFLLCVVAVSKAAAISPIFGSGGAGGGGDALKADPLSQFAATTSSQFKGVISDENAPDGASSKVIMALGSLSIASGKTATVSNTLTLAGTDSTTMTFPTTSATIARTDAANTFTGHQTVEGVTSTGATGTGKFVFDGSPTLVTPVLGVASATSITSRIIPRITTIVSSATPTINTDNCDAVTITALAAAINTMTSNLSGAPNNFDKLIFRIKDDGTARAITWGASFEAKGVALPTTTVLSKVLTVGFIYDSVALKWGCVASSQEL